jgi:hypothetical protein
MVMQRLRLITILVLLLLLFTSVGPAIGDPVDDKDKGPTTNNGRQQALDDINADGYPDIIFSQFSQVSYIYWGSAKGYSSTNRLELSTIYAEAASVADLDKDGYKDIVFSNNGGFGNWDIDSYIYWGSASGYSTNDRTTLPTHGASGNTIVDINYDGWLDIIFCNAMTGDWTSNITSYIYLGSSNGFSVNNRIELPTIGVYDLKVIDLDKNGYLDIIFANEEDADDPPIHTHHVNSYVYWGSAKGFSTSDRTELPTYSADDVEAADFNMDGYIDIVFSLSCDGGPNGYSYVYWGSAKGFNQNDKTQLPTNNAQGVVVADFNNDKYTDILFANQGGSESYIYLASAQGFSAQNKITLPTTTPFHPDLADLNGDGFLDVVLADYSDTTSPIFYGGSSGLDTAKPDHIETSNAYSVTIVGGRIEKKAPDLSIVEAGISFIPQSPVNTGSKVTITANIMNLGNQNANKTRVAFYDGDPDYSGILIGQELIPHDFIMGQGKEVSTDYDAQKQGTHKIYVKVWNCVPNEDVITNNKAFKELDVSVAPSRPDLTIKLEDLTIAPVPPKVGLTESITALVRNIGASAAKSVSIEFLIDGNEIARKEQTSALAPNGSTKFETTWVPSAEGAHTISAIVDPDNKIEEANETNNKAEKTITVLPPDKPDLSITNSDISFSSSPPIVGSTIFVNAIIFNLGTANAKDVEVRYLTNGTPVFNNDITVGLVHMNNGFVILSEPFQPTTAGTYNISVVLDPLDKINEMSETNNIAYRSIEISPNVTGVNHPPRFISQPSKTATPSIQYFYDSEAVDEDGDLLEYVLLTPIYGMTFDASSGLITWKPLVNQTGKTLIRIGVKDGRGGEAEQDYELDVIYNKPKCSINYPVQGQTVKDIVKVDGTTVKGTLPVIQNQIRIDGGPWQKVVGIDTWTFNINTTLMSNGPHKIEAQALDTISGSDIVSVNITVNNPSPFNPVKYKTSLEVYPWAVVAICSITTGLTVVLRYRKESSRRYLKN